MELFHATDETGLQGIRAGGFRISHVGDSAAWFADTREGAATGRAGRSWLVIVDLPEDEAEKYRYRFEDGEAYLGNLCIPFEVVNAVAPFRFERAQLQETPADGCRFSPGQAPGDDVDRPSPCARSVHSVAD